MLIRNVSHRASILGQPHCKNPNEHFHAAFVGGLPSVQAARWLDFWGGYSRENYRENEVQRVKEIVEHWVVSIIRILRSGQGYNGQLLAPIGSYGPVWRA